MDKKFVKVIEERSLEKEELIVEKEIEVAFKILSELNGMLAIRATSVLNFCIKAIQFNEVNLH